MKKIIPCLIIIGVFASASFAGFDYTISSEYDHGTITLNNESLLVTGAGAHLIGANFSSYVEVRDTAPLELDVGGIYTLSLYNNSTMNYYGGETGALRLRDNAKATISGGQISYISSFQDVPTPNNIAYPHIEIICRDWEHDVDTNILTGTWEDFSTFDIQLVNQAGYDPVIDNIKITIIPEPATLLLFGVGGLLLRKRRS